ncbi:MAG TPA: hypothetical protein VHM24_13510 [Gemmatimonadaceae bacterium]|nr:hypothetical protein [Gemmatimonadaceae bacterium]
MLRSWNHRFAVVIVASLVAAGIAAAGPPWIAIEYPANPHDPNTRGAFLTVRTYHHGDLMSYDIAGTAEGLVKGQRKSMPLDIKRLPHAGTYAVRWQKPAEGSWALVISTARDGNSMASALIDIDARGRVASVTVPSNPIEGGRWQMPRRVAASEIDAVLRAPKM